MGQQQLLLLVLGAIIVGVAIVVGMNMFSTSAVNANRDAVVQDCMTLATRAQQWYRTPTILGGGGRSFASISLNAIRFTSPNENGSYVLSSPSEGSITVTGTGREPQANPGTVAIVVVPDSIRTPLFGAGWSTN